RQFFLHLVFLGYALTTPSFHRTLAAYAWGVGATVAADLALQLAREKRVFFPLSAVITSFGFQLLVAARSAWMYAALGAAAMAAKNLVRWRGRHVFNPSNFVIVAVLLVVPSGPLAVVGGWGGSLWGLALAALLGVLVVRRADRLGVVGGYLAGFVAGAAVLHLALERPLGACLSPLWDPLFPIFAFFMITDPRTTPGGSREGVPCARAARCTPRSTRCSRSPPSRRPSPRCSPRPRRRRRAERQPSTSRATISDWTSVVPS
ncbi:MAG: hypothetical protein HY079_05295, partial [Elusimicrobia bacterium]|nr:hypothetical protein [Elusimicrobiota bacterium]